MFVSKTTSKAVLLNIKKKLLLRKLQQKRMLLGLKKLSFNECQFFVPTWDLHTKFRFKTVVLPELPIPKLAADFDGYVDPQFKINQIVVKRLREVSQDMTISIALNQQG
jgi:hypothetical protein